MLLPRTKKKPAVKLSTKITHGGATPEDERENRIAAELEFNKQVRVYKRRGARYEPPARFVKSQPCHVYFMRVGDWIKIGHARNVTRRVTEVQVHCPLDVTLLVSVAGDATMERIVQRKFQSFRCRGEWYQAAPEIIEFVEQLKSGAPLQSLLAYTLKHTLNTQTSASISN